MCVLVACAFSCRGHRGRGCGNATLGILQWKKRQAKVAEVMVSFYAGLWVEQAKTIEH